MVNDATNQIMDDVERFHEEGLKIMKLINSEEGFNALLILEGCDITTSLKARSPSLQNPQMLTALAQGKMIQI